MGLTLLINEISTLPNEIALALDEFNVLEDPVILSSLDNDPAESKHAAGVGCPGRSADGGCRVRRTRVAKRVGHCAVGAPAVGMDRRVILLQFMCRGGYNCC